MGSAWATGRPEKSGVFGRFDVEEVIELADAAAARPSPPGAGQGTVAGLGEAGRPDGPDCHIRTHAIARVPVAGNRVAAWHGGAGPWHG